MVTHLNSSASLSNQGYCTCCSECATHEKSPKVQSLVYASRSVLVANGLSTMYERSQNPMRLSALLIRVWLIAMLFLGIGVLQRMRYLRSHKRCGWCRR